MSKAKSKPQKTSTERSPAGSVYKPFQIVQPPSVIARICHSSEYSYEKLAEKAQFQLQSLMRSNRGPYIKHINQNRQTYRGIKQKIGTKFQNFSKDIQNLNLGQILVWKQQILASFLNQFLIELTKECKQKAQILLFIWNSIFNIIEYLIQINGKMRHKEEKDYLSSLLENHKQYQSVIQNLKNKIAKNEQSFVQQEQFIKALVYNLRYKRKEVKKITKNLKMCTVKLNQFKDFYLDLQIEHIELLSENRDISKENALNLIKRKQELNHEKRKQYRMKQSHKKIKFQIENQIEHQNANQAENVNKLNQDLKTTFNSYYRKKKKIKTNASNIEECTENIFENALDDFNVRIQNVPETESLIDFKSNIAFIDAHTDMDDFQRDVQDVSTEITYTDRLYQDMMYILKIYRSHAAVQTQEIKSKQKQLEQEGVQVNLNELKNIKMNRVKVYDRSYILSDYRDKKYRTQKGLMSSNGLNRSNQLNFSKLSGEGDLRRTRNREGGIDVQIQTDYQAAVDLKGVPNEVRDSRLEKDIQSYFKKINNLRSSLDKITFNWGSSSDKRKNINKRVNFSSSNPSFSHQDDQQTEINTARPLSRKIHFKNSSSSTHFFNSRNSTPTRRDSDIVNSQGKISLTKTYIKNQFEEIKENNYENMISGEMEPDDRQSTQRNIASHSQKVRKFWVMKPMTADPISHRKQRFLNDLNAGDHFLSKRTHYKADNFQQNKKMLMQLQKLSEQIQSHHSNLELIQTNVSENMNILQEQLKKMLNKKKNNRILPVSRQQSLCRIISFVYTYAYHLYFNHGKSIQSMIIPLFHYFKIGYGEIKKNDLYLRMLYFLSQVICHQNQNYIFQNFILFLGLRIKSENDLRIGKDITCLHLRLLHKLSVNFRFPIDVEDLYTTVHCLDTKCKEILLEQHLEENIVDFIIEKVKGKLKGLAKQWQTPQEQQRNKEQFGQTKLNVFRCCELIIFQIQKIKTALEDSYTPLLQYFSIFKEEQHKLFTKYLLKNYYLTRKESLIKDKKMEEQMGALQKIQKSQKKVQILMKSLLQINIPEFNKLYYYALSKFKIKEEFLYLSLNRRLSFLMRFIQREEESFFVELKLINSIINKEQKLSVKDETSKKIMALAYLRVVEHQTEWLLEATLGQDLTFIYTLDVGNIIR